MDLRETAKAVLRSGFFLELQNDAVNIFRLSTMAAFFICPNESAASKNIPQYFSSSAVIVMNRWHVLNCFAKSV